MGDPLLIGCTQVESFLILHSLSILRCPRSWSSATYSYPEYPIYPVLFSTIWRITLWATLILPVLSTPPFHRPYRIGAYSFSLPILSSISFPIVGHSALNPMGGSDRRSAGPLSWWRYPIRVYPIPTYSTLLPAGGIYPTPTYSRAIIRRTGYHVAEYYVDWPGVGAVVLGRDRSLSYLS